jgi:hypothetical protein
MLRWSLNAAHVQPSKALEVLEAERSHHLKSLCEHTDPERRMSKDDVEKFGSLTNTAFAAVGELLKAKEISASVCVSVHGLSDVPNRDDHVTDSVQVHIDFYDKDPTEVKTVKPKPVQKATL